MECIIEMFSGLNTRTRADLLAQLVTKNSELISSKRNNSQIVSIPSPPSQNNEIQNQINLNLNNQSQDQANLPQSQPVSDLPETGNITNRRNRYKDDLKQYAVDKYLELNNYCKAAVETQLLSKQKN